MTRCAANGLLHSGGHETAPSASTAASAIKSSFRFISQSSYEITCSISGNRSRPRGYPGRGSDALSEPRPLGSAWHLVLFPLADSRQLVPRQHVHDSRGAEGGLHGDHGGMLVRHLADDGALPAQRVLVHGGQHVAGGLGGDDGHKFAFI